MPSSIAAELVAVIVSVDEESPRVLASGSPAALPHGPLEPEHRSLQAGLRAWTREREGVELGFVEQLYTFADVGRSGRSGRTVAISYLGLTRAKGEAGWVDVYGLLPWEDARDGLPALTVELGEVLVDWADGDAERLERTQHAFGLEGWAWRPELVLQRYELLWEAGLVAERPEGRNVFYRAEPEGLAPLVDWIGHYGVFSGKKWNNEIYPLLRDFVHFNS